MSRQYKPGDIVQITSKRSVHYGDKGIFVRYCDRAEAGICTVLIMYGGAISCSTSSIDLVTTRNHDISFDECWHFIKRNVHLCYPNQRAAVHSLCEGECVDYCYNQKSIITAFIDYVRFTYKDVSIPQTELTVSWEELFELL